MRNRKHDIEKYLRGELSPSEMHALEKEALSDPFLAEALEGIEQAGADKFLYDLHKINRSVHDRTRKRLRKNSKTIRMWGWTSAVAATVVLLAVSGFLVVQILRDQAAREESAGSASTDPRPANPAADSLAVDNTDSSLLALQKPEPAAESPTRDSDEKAKESDRAPGKNEEPRRDAKPVIREESRTGEQLQNPPPVAKSDPIKKDNAPQARADAEVSDDHVTASEAIPIDSVRSDLASNDAAKRSLEGKVAGIQTEKARGAVTRSMSPVTVVKGQVKSEDGHGLPGVNVLIQGTTQATTTDGEGHFSIAVPDDAHLVFSFIGFDTQVLAADRSELSVTLEEDISTLSEVVVTGYSRNPSGAEEEASFHSAEPTVGQTDFKNYLANAVKYPQEAIRNKTEGKVTVRFTVEPNGQLSDFEVVKGIGSGCEEELIRAIQQGPYWKPSKRGDQPIKDKVRVRFRFNLPK
jgi:TonB family protein